METVLGMTGLQNKIEHSFLGLKEFSAKVPQFITLQEKLTKLN
jgi:hypothetical protein